MSDAPLFEPQPPELPDIWITQDGPDRDVAVSTRMRLARNLENYHFKSRQEPEEGKLLTQFLRDTVADAAPHLKWLPMSDTTDVVRRVLFERHLVSREHVEDDHPRGLAYSDDGTTSVMVNEEDHLRIQVFSAGLGLETLGERVNDLDMALARKTRFAFSERYGYLTACPTNTGTGLRVSVMLHLPALSHRVVGKSKGDEQGIEKVHNAAQKLGLTVRGMHGEASRAEGDFYQISNQVTLGRTPEQAIQDLNAVLPTVIEWERHVRRILLEESREHLEDHVWRAWAILCNARRMESAEAVELLSAIRLGVTLGLMEETNLGTIHHLLVAIMPAHLQFMERRELQPDERDMVRATLIRDTFAK